MNVFCGIIRFFPFFYFLGGGREGFLEGVCVVEVGFL